MCIKMIVTAITMAASTPATVLLGDPPPTLHQRGSWGSCPPQEHAHHYRITTVAQMGGDMKSKKNAWRGDIGGADASSATFVDRRRASGGPVMLSASVDLAASACCAQP